MGISRGSQAIERWRKNLGREVARVTLVAELAGTDGEEVGEWFADTVTEDGDDPENATIGFRDPQWSKIVFELAQEDTIGRGQGTRYSVRSFYDGENRARSRTHMQMVMPRDSSEKDDERASRLDGSTASVIQQLQRMTDAANKNMFDMVKLLQTSATQNNALVTQLSTSLREKEETIAKLVDLRVSDKIELATKLEQETRNGGAGTGSSMIDTEFKGLLEQAMPHLAKALVSTATEKIGPLLELVVAMMSAPDAAQVSAPAPAAAIASTVASTVASTIVDTKNVQ